MSGNGRINWDVSGDKDGRESKRWLVRPGTKFMNLFCYLLIKFYAAGRMKSNCDKLIHGRITNFMHA